jgi:hypothetical protein
MSKKETKAAEKPGAKPGVKFAGQDPAGGVKDEEVKVVEKKKEYHDPEWCRENAIKAFNDAESLLMLFTANDVLVKRPDTAKSMVRILNVLKDALEYINISTPLDKETNYYLTYNGTIYISDICQNLKRSVYSLLAIDFLAFCLNSIEMNIVLLGIKYLDWRIKLYLELAHSYEENDSLSAALKVIEAAIEKVNQLKELEESDAPVPEHITKILTNNLYILRAHELKYKLQVIGM